MKTCSTPNSDARSNSRLSALMRPAVALNLHAMREAAHRNAALIEIDMDGTIKAMNASAAWLLRCGFHQYVGEPAAQILPALNRGLDALATANRNGIALRTDGKIIHVRTTGIPYQSEQSSGWKILMERS